ncbi:uncharacterized protein LOC128018208 [Carassius gibelio]|uniref:uncharacterized protein LOC128018208 n=1 Tax=Carassius gibelio TaxID=101364 RepID=UPI0022780849|nr:uncharacterized protein LOC128018208 [Carassius gibelio]XP_052459541.1 uncharacterized protein LOC128018208 [Carassius gibelio]
MEVLKWRTGISAEGLSARLLLHNTLQKWTLQVFAHFSLRFHRSAHDRAVQRAVLLEWDRHTQAAFSERVLLFTDRLAHLHPSSSVSPCSDPLMFIAAPQYERCVLQRAWLTWRKRHIRNRVSADHAAAINSTLLAQVLQVWWQLAHRTDSES